MRFNKTVFAGAFAALAFSFNAAAHLPYVLPFQFHTDQDVATLYAGSADRYFEPEIAGGNPGNGYYDVTVTDPSGKTGYVESISRHKQITLIEIDTKADGTYKVSRALVSSPLPHIAYEGRALQVSPWNKDRTDEQKKAALARRFDEGGQRVFFFNNEVKPEATENVRFINHVTAYVTKGKPTDAALKTSGKGLEFDFKVHPSQISVKSGLQFVALLDGRPQPEMSFNVYREGDDKPSSQVVADKAGVVRFAFAQPGVYVINARSPGLVNGEVVTTRYINWLAVEVAK